MRLSLEHLRQQLSMLETPYSPRLQNAVLFAVEAGQQTLNHFQDNQLQVEIKDDRSPVTVADTDAESLLRERITAAFPDDSILGEEFEDVHGTSGYRWLIDPIDGTKSFISGVPLYATLVGIEFQGESQIGVIYLPALDELIFAQTGQGVHYCRGNSELSVPCVSDVKALSDSCFVTTQLSSYDQTDRRDRYQVIEEKASITRTWGDAYGYLLVATGRAEVMIDPVMNVWDAAAILPILQEAGGTFTDWQGVSTIHNAEGIATNGHCLQEVLDITRDA